MWQTNTMPRRRRFHELPFIPAVIAETVCKQPYTGMELSERARPSQNDIDRIEDLRQKMDNKLFGHFCALVHQMCFLAYDAKSEWFMKCVRAKDNRGRDQLYAWISHWLAAYLTDPVRFTKNWEQTLTSMVEDRDDA